MKQPIFTRPSSISRLDQILVLALSLYCLGLFLPSFTAMERIGLVVAALISCVDGRWRAVLPYLRHPIFLLTAALVVWLGLTAVWSVDPTVTTSSWWSIFKDYLLFVPPMCYLLEDKQRREWLTTALGICGAVIVIINGAQYVREFLVDPTLLLNIKTHRGWAHPLVFFVPFAVVQAATARGRRAALWYGLFAMEVAMIFATGARGAWLALFSALAALGLTRELRLKTTVFLAIAMLTAVVAFMTLPSNLFRDRFAKGLDTSMRTTGTWGPSIEMMNERPWSGFGFGKQIFDREFNARAPINESWSIKKSKGPHSIYFEAGFAGGYPGLVLISVLFAAAVAYGAKALYSRHAFEHRAFVLATWASLIGFYVARGAFESTRWGPLIVLICGIAHFSRATAVVKAAAQKDTPESTHGIIGWPSSKD